MAAAEMGKVRPDRTLPRNPAVHPVPKHQAGEGAGGTAAKTGVNPNNIAFRGEVELINAAWTLDSGRTVELRIAGDAYTRLHPFKCFQHKRNGRMGTRFRFAAASTKDGNIFFAGEVMLAGWKDSSYSGQCITLWLDDEADRHPFAGFDRRRNGTPGDLFAIALVEIGDDERAIDQKKRERADDAGASTPGGSGGAAPQAQRVAGGATQSRSSGRGPRRYKASQQAHLLVTGSMFVRYLQETRPKLVKKWTPELARRWVKAEINVESLSELDRNQEALSRYEDKIRKPFARWNGQEP